jgi:plasmid replication initiation protein
LGVPPEAYKITKDFKRKVIDTSIREINESGLSLSAEVKYDQEGKGIALKSGKIVFTKHEMLPDPPRKKRGRPRQVKTAPDGQGELGLS